jgi:AcrR family transcriptional regulator
MEDIGKEAGIPRSYLYRFVSGRDELVISVVFQLTKDIVGKYEPLLIQAPSFAVGLTDMAIEAVHGMRNDPELENLLETTPGMGLPELFVGPGAMNIQLGLGFLAPALEKARQNGKLRDDVTDSEIIEWLISVLLMMILRHDLDVERERAMIRRFVLPGLSPWAAECDVS